MSQAFWLSPESISLTMHDIARLDDNQARYMLASMRWPGGQPVCPTCGSMEKHYDIRVRKQWRCSDCEQTFSVTSGTPFADHKISYTRLLMGIVAFVVNQKGLAALALRRIIGGTYRTSFTLLHKIREAVMLTASEEKMSGLIEIDGGHFSGRPRKGRKLKKDRTPAIPKKYQREPQQRDRSHASEFPHHPNRRIVMVLREVMPPIDGEPSGLGAMRTVVAICRSENRDDVEALVKKHVDVDSTIRSDELSAYGNLKLMGYFHETVNHSVEFATDGGVNQNQAESFFSRMRRAYIGIYHRITPRYMLDYASEMAWREDVRRRSTGEQVSILVRRVFRSGVSPDWCGYGHGNKRGAELMFSASSA
jgi:transposase-like protein